MYKNILLLFVFGALFSCSKSDISILEEKFNLTGLKYTYGQCVGAQGSLNISYHQLPFLVDKKTGDQMETPDYMYVEVVMKKFVKSIVDGDKDKEINIKHLYNKKTGILDTTPSEMIVDGEYIELIVLQNLELQVFCLPHKY
jgi:hypothetical protein